jgi:flagellar basal-body rod protein FlgB
MGLTSIPLFSALAEKMKWHQTRQGLLAENVANAETPGYRGRDLKAEGFEEHMRNLSVASISTVATDPGHIVKAGSGADGFGSRQLNNFEITPEGNGVTLEDEMMKVSTNQMDYQAVTAIYSRSIRIIKTALGRQS